jgi:hypothetical protein
MTYKEQEAKAFLEDVLDQLDEACDVALLRSAKYQQALRRFDSRHVWGRAFNVRDLVLHLVQSNKDRHKLSPPWEGPTPSWRYFDRAPTSSRPSIAKPSPMHGTLNNYVTFTSSLCTYI